MPRKPNYIERRDKVDGGYMITQYDQKVFNELYKQAWREYKQHSLNRSQKAWRDIKYRRSIIGRLRRTIMSILKFFRTNNYTFYTFGE